MKNFKNILLFSFVSMLFIGYNASTRGVTVSYVEADVNGTEVILIGDKHGLNPDLDGPNSRALFEKIKGPWSSEKTRFALELHRELSLEELEGIKNGAFLGSAIFRTFDFALKCKQTFKGLNFVFSDPRSQISKNFRSFLFSLSEGKIDQQEIKRTLENMLTPEQIKVSYFVNDIEVTLKTLKDFFEQQGFLGQSLRLSGFLNYIDSDIEQLKVFLLDGYPNEPIYNALSQSIFTYNSLEGIKNFHDIFFRVNASMASLQMLADVIVGIMDPECVRQVGYFGGAHLDDIKEILEDIFGSEFHLKKYRSMRNYEPISEEEQTRLFSSDASEDMIDEPAYSPMLGDTILCNNNIEDKHLLGMGFGTEEIRIARVDVAERASQELARRLEEIEKARTQRLIAEIIMQQPEIEDERLCVMGFDQKLIDEVRLSLRRMHEMEQFKRGFMELIMRSRMMGASPQLVIAPDGLIGVAICPPTGFRIPQFRRPKEDEVEEEGETARSLISEEERSRKLEQRRVARQKEQERLQRERLERKHRRRKVNEQIKANKRSRRNARTNTEDDSKAGANEGSEVIFVGQDGDEFSVDELRQKRLAKYSSSKQQEEAQRRLEEEIMARQQAEEEALREKQENEVRIKEAINRSKELRKEYRGSNFTLGDLVKKLHSEGFTRDQVKTAIEPLKVKLRAKKKRQEIEKARRRSRLQKKAAVKQQEDEESVSTARSSHLSSPGNRKRRTSTTRPRRKRTSAGSGVRRAVSTISRGASGLASLSSGQKRRTGVDKGRSTRRLIRRPRTSVGTGGRRAVSTTRRGVSGLASSSSGQRRRTRVDKGRSTRRLIRRPRTSVGSGTRRAVSTTRRGASGLASSSSGQRRRTRVDKGRSTRKKLIQRKKRIKKKRV